MEFESCHLFLKSCIFRVLAGPIIVRLRFFSNDRTSLALLPPSLMNHINCVIFFRYCIIDNLGYQKLL